MLPEEKAFENSQIIVLHSQQLPLLSPGIANALEFMKRTNQYRNTIIISEDWVRMNIPSACPLVKQWRVAHNLYLQKNKHANILKEIQDIEFPMLKYLNLERNEIQEIQPICRIYAPCLQQLFLNNNFITFIHSLKKSYFPNLSYIKLDGNCINNFSALSQLFAPELTEITLEEKFSLNDECSSLWIFKLESTIMQHIDVTVVMERNSKRLMRSWQKAQHNYRADIHWKKFVQMKINLSTIREVKGFRPFI